MWHELWFCEELWADCVISLQKSLDLQGHECGSPGAEMLAAVTTPSVHVSFILISSSRLFYHLVLVSTEPRHAGLRQTPLALLKPSRQTQINILPSSWYFDLASVRESSNNSHVFGLVEITQNNAGVLKHLQFVYCKTAAQKYASATHVWLRFHVRCRFPNESN